MRTVFIASTAVVALALALGIAAASATSLEQVKKEGFVRGANANETPYGFMDADGNGKGIGPEVAAEVWKSIGVKDVTWSVTPFGTLIPGLKAGRYDFVGAEQNVLPDRCKQVAFTEPNSSYGEGLLVKAGNPKHLHSYEDIARDPTVKVAVVSGADNFDFLHAVGVSDSQIVIIQANADAPSTVRTGRADAYGATELTVARLVSGSIDLEQAAPFSDPIVKGKPIRSYGAFAFRLQDKALYDAFNKALVKFKETPQYKKILTSYGVSSSSIDAASSKTMDALCTGN